MGRDPEGQPQLSFDRWVGMRTLECDVQDYAWGDPAFIPSLTGVAPTGEPQAELRMGAHPKAPSRLSEGGMSLGDLINESPTAQL
ncbi:MAG: mannose-6-phosphate isomerase [Candidatus Poriferisodalaceae bacterium]